MSGEVGKRVRELVREVCKGNDVEILKGHVSKDHVHIFVSVPPHLAVSKLVKYLKGKSSYKLMQENKQISKSFGAGTFGHEDILGLPLEISRTKRF
jgi:putative transposase